MNNTTVLLIAICNDQKNQLPENLQYRLSLGVVDEYTGKVRVVRFYFDKPSDIAAWMQKLNKKIKKGKLKPEVFADKYYAPKLKNPQKMNVVEGAREVIKKHKNHMFNSERKHHAENTFFLLYENGQLYVADTQVKQPNFNPLD